MKNRTNNAAVDSQPKSPVTDDVAAMKTQGIVAQLDAWKALTGAVKIPERFQGMDVIYAFPEDLLNGLGEHCPRLLTPEEMDFESALCDQHNRARIAGFFHRLPIPLGVLAVEEGPREAAEADLPLAKPAFEGEEGLTDETLRLRLERLHEKTNPIYENLRG